MTYVCVIVTPVCVDDGRDDSDMLLMMMMMTSIIDGQLEIFIIDAGIITFDMMLFVTFHSTHNDINIDGIPSSDPNDDTTHSQ